MVDLGQGFTPRFGKVTEQMPVLRKAGETPVSMNMVLEKQYAHPDTWGQTYVFTGDAILTGTDGDGVIDKASALLYAVDERSKLQNNALVLEDAQYEAVRYGRGVAHLSAAELEKAHGKGFVKVRGVWQPENSTVGYVWDVLTDGRDLKNHAELASQKSSGAEQVMCLYFDQGKREQPTLRAWCVNGLNYRSDANGYNYLYNDYGPLVGVAPEALEQARSAARDPTTLRARLETGLEQYVAGPMISVAADYVVGEAVRFAARK